MKTNYYQPTSLLTTNNAKTIKGEKLGYTTYILYMSPFRQNSQKKNICPMATPGCAAACLYTSGHGSMDNVKKGRTNKTEFFLSDRNKFLMSIYSEIAQLEVKYKIEGGKFAVRLNGTSDISWEKFKIKDNKNIFELFPKVQFYDYTKNHLRFQNKLPKNYRLVFSRSETNEPIALALLAKGVNVAMVFDETPKKYKSYKVINGDENDLRFLDGKGVIVGLKYKKITGKGANNQKAFESGFAIKLAA
jgi:hypothetical protein